MSGPKGAFTCLLALASMGRTPRPQDATDYATPTTSFKHRQAAAHTPLGCSGDGWDTAAAPGQAIASSSFLSTEFLNTSDLHGEDVESARRET